VGRLTPVKNLETLIQALYLVPVVTGVLIGGGELRPVLEEMVQQRGMSNVRFLGPIENASQLMPLFDVLCLPSRQEGLGVVLIEAMQQSVPIIGSRGGAIPEILGDGEYGILFETENPQSLANAIRFAKANPQQLGVLAARAHDYAKREFHAQAMAEKTVSVYKEVTRA